MLPIPAWAELELEKLLFADLFAAAFA
jgi:hypothetical protein